jgi:hypothetical protein
MKHPIKTAVSIAAFAGVSGNLLNALSETVDAPVAVLVDKKSATIWITAKVRGAEARAHGENFAEVVEAFMESAQRAIAAGTAAVMSDQ